MINILLAILWFSKYALTDNNVKCECLNGGTCQTSIDANQTANLSCICPPGDRFSGSRCEIDKCYPMLKSCSKICWVDNHCNCKCGQGCIETFCNNLGICVLNDEEKLYCKCLGGYYGTRCENQIPRQEPQLKNLCLEPLIAMLLIVLCVTLIIIIYYCHSMKDRIGGYIKSIRPLKRKTIEAINNAENLIS